jgi:transposase
LATGLDSVSVAARWIAFECERNERLMRVDHVQPRMARVDSTTAAAFVTPEGLFQRGHRKAHRPDLPQVKISMAVLAPLGLPLTTTVVAGNTADAPFYLPEIATVRQIAQRTGLTYVGDCTMAAIGTRAEIVAHQDDSLCPLSATQVPPAELDRLRNPVFTGRLQPTDIRLPNAHGPIEAMDDPVAVGFAYTVEQSAKDQSGQMQCWQERRLVVRSLAWATSQEQHVRERVARAVAALNARDERQQGKTRLPDEAAARQAAEAILLTQRGAGLGHVAVTTAVHEHVKRRDGTRPATTMRSARVRVSATTDAAALAQAARRLGWRVYATHHPAAALRVEQAVAAYRSAYLIEQGFGRLKGHALSLTPLFLHDDHRVVGLVSLLSRALRVLVLVQCVVRRNLHTEGATLTGISPGQPGRQTAQPTTAMLLRALRGVTLSRIRLHGKTYEHMTPLNAVQQRILKLLEMPPDIYDGIVTRFSKTDFHSRET